MDILKILLERTKEGGFLSGFRVRGWRCPMLFVDDTLVLCDATQGQMIHVGWVLMWFEAISRLKINMEKS